MPEPFSTDVLIIGGGIAGARAAQAAVEAGASTLVVSKAPMGSGGASSRASGGFAAAVGANDSAASHAADMMSGGYQLNAPSMVKLITEHAPSALQRLDAEVEERFSAGRGLEGRPAPMHSVARSVQYPGGMTHLMGLLREKLVGQGVKLLEDHRAVDLLPSGKGVQVFDNASGAFLECHATATVIAAGGCGQLFPVTSNGADATGDGYGLALRAGFALQDMEFIQYTPTAFAAPNALRGHTIVGTLLTLEGVQLINAAGERFMARYAPEQLECADRATLARAIFREVSEGRGTASGGVYLNATGVSKDTFNRHRPGFYDLCMAHGIDPCSTALETAPAVHTCLGGVRVDGELSLAPNVFCAGEVIAGSHGANRLSSNSLTEANVTGWMAGRLAAKVASEEPKSAVGYGAPEQFQPGAAKVDVAGLKSRLQDVMGKVAGVERSAEHLAKGLEMLTNLKSEHAVSFPRSTEDVGQWLDLRNMLIVAQSILGSAMERQESRGAHVRSDYPELSDERWRGNISAALREGEMVFTYEPL